MTILIIEDEKKLSDILKKTLKGERYSVDTAYDGEEGLVKARKNTYELIILDIMLPKKDGVAVCKELRSSNIHTPIIMLTSNENTKDKINSLDVGADDCMIKPFDIQELFARIRAILRRRKTTDSDVWKIEDLVLDRIKHEVTRSGKYINLTPKEYKILNMLLTHKGEAISREKLIANVWTPEFKESNNELNVHIRYLRTKIDRKGDKPLVHTVRGVGFMMKD
ncbi:MAG: response regulator transcription factor [Candidatus Zambryskibacteria bacterium]|nr:response regulator transcription factor [Candidatus Zambryskibacteria bacterium]